jgi:hypothetical protein
MLGITKELAAELAARGYTEADVARLFGRHAQQGELRVRYARPNGDLTSPLPSSRHMQYVAKGWTAASLDIEAEPARTEPTDVPAEILEHARHDRIAEWQRGEDQILSSCRNAASLIEKGFTFAGLADSVRLRAVAEARPCPRSWMRRSRRVRRRKGEREPCATVDAVAAFRFRDGSGDGNPTRVEYEQRGTARVRFSSQLEHGKSFRIRSATQGRTRQGRVSPRLRVADGHTVPARPRYTVDVRSGSQRKGAAR